MQLLKRRFLSASIVVFGLAATVGACASNEVQDRYLFDVVKQPVPVGARSAITVRMIDTASGQPVNGATISDAGLTMKGPISVPREKVAPLPHRPHSEEIQFVGASGVGEYSFVGDVSMPGTWELFLTARVPGETSPVEGSARFVAGR
jgi:hypothetical protein